LNLKKCSFDQCQIREADFTGADCTALRFSGCDLALTNFDNTNLSGADFRSAKHFTIHPGNNKIKKAKFRNDALSGLLAHLDIDIEE
jgi:uncharacterized protein YjbI with pentapeptide repeats